jgi:OmpA-OmpF porin, OOP family
MVVVQLNRQSSRRKNTMAIFDSIISEVAGKFGLGDKAGPLVGALLSMITSSEGGGLAGFISKFTGAGMGDLVNSWVSTGDSQPISENQLSSVLGGDAISGIADKVGIPGSLASSALAFLLPSVISKLTPDGIVPTSLPDTIMNYIGGLTGMLGKGVSGVTDAAGSVASGAADLAGKGVDAVGDLASGAAGLAGKGIGAAGNLATGAAGAVGAGLAGAGAAGVAGARAAANMAEDTAKSGMSWLLKLLPLLLLAVFAYLAYQYCNSSTPTTPVATVKPTVVTTATPVPAPSVKLTGADGKLDAAAAVKNAAAAAAGALGALKPGYTADELVKALNLEIINFASGSNGIPKENEELLKKSAAAIVGAPAGTKLEVGGYTDNKGAAAGNLTLSQKRAAAVMAYLVKNGVKADGLTAKGHGADNPKASNETEEGRFQNRRIEFSVAK